MSPTPRFNGLAPSCPQASAAARGASRKSDTEPERALRKALWRNGLRFRKNLASLPGAPDIAFPKARVLVFVDGDFWHGKDWTVRRAKIRQGHNALYWVHKIERNIDRDREQVSQLQRDGWTVLRVWESDIRENLDSVVRIIKIALNEKAKKLRNPTRR